MKNYRRKKRIKKIPYSFHIAKDGMAIGNLNGISIEEATNSWTMDDLLKAYNQIMKHSYLPETIILTPENYQRWKHLLGLEDEED